MRKVLVKLLLVSMLFPASLVAENGGWSARVVGGSDYDLLKAEPQLNILIGSYDIIGRYPDSNKTYAGTARISIRDNKFFIIRTIEGHQIEAEGYFEWPLADVARHADNKLMVFKWQDGKGLKWVSRCLSRNDLNNHARVTCQLGDPAKHRRPGLEALFPVTNANRN